MMRTWNITRILFLLLIILVMAVSCRKENNAIEEIDQLEDETYCIKPDTQKDTITGFYVFEKGKQEFGFAKGIKINQPFEASVFLRDMWNDNSKFTISIIGYWSMLPQNGHSAEAESINIGSLKKDTMKSCNDLTFNLNSPDSTFITYNVVNDDVHVLSYKLDLSGHNKLEIISYNKETNRLKAKLSASFVTDKEFPPLLPKKVRFSDVYIEHGY